MSGYRCIETLPEFTYVQGPEEYVRNDPVAPKWVDSPQNVVQIFDIAEIQD